MPSVTISTKPITRQKLAQYFPDNHELVRLLETLSRDVVVNLPDIINPDSQTLEDTVEALGTAQALAQAAQALALQALAAAVQGTDGPPVLNVLIARIAELERAVAQLSEKPTP